MRSFQHHGLNAVRRVIFGIDVKRTADEPVGPLQVACGVWALYPGNTRAVISRELDQRTHVARINAQRPLTEIVIWCSDRTAVTIRGGLAPHRQILSVKVRDGGAYRAPGLCLNEFDVKRARESRDNVVLRQ